MTSLLSWNTFHLDAKAREFTEYTSIDQLCQLLNKHPNDKILHIGRGSNLLFVNDFDGIVLHSAINYISKGNEDKDYVYLRVGSGVLFDNFIDYAVRHGWGGAENLSYIPGEVGASAVQNIGAYGVEVKDIITSVETIEIATLRPRKFNITECNYGYRDSIFKQQLKNQYIVTAVNFRLTKQSQLQLEYGNVSQNITEHTIAGVRQAIIKIRQQKLPEIDELGSAGSFFKNPVISPVLFNQLQKQYPDIPHYDAEGGIKIPAAWLITQAGLKGKRIGGAQVYEKQPLVIVNTGNATADDIVNLAQLIQQTIMEKFNIEIHPEVNYIA